MISSDTTLIATSTSSSAPYNVTFSYVIERCRNCKHAHTQSGGMGCYDVMGGAVVFVLCQCKEHVPQDNLEFLEYLMKKKESL